MKVATIFGTRPEIIRLSEVVRLLDRFCEQVLIHTGQNFDPLLSDIFLSELNFRQPDVHLGIESAGFADQAGKIIARTGDLLARLRPDRVLILGDTNSGLAAFPAARMGIPVFHMEAGNRCYDDRVPEEINRRIIDHCSAVLMPYTHRSKDNLIREGIPRARIFVTGNPIFEVLRVHSPAIESSSVLDRLELDAGNYFLSTLHRAENVDQPARLQQLMDGLSLVADTFSQPVIVSVHPRTADVMSRHSIAPESRRVRLLKPMGFFDFARLESRARCVLSDSGTVQEESCIFSVPSVTVRDVTERAETTESGSNILSGSNPESLLSAVRIATGCSTAWHPPAEYTTDNVSTTVAKVLLGYHHGT